MVDLSDLEKDPQSERMQKKKGKADEEKVQYPTKNFLQNFRRAHLDYILKSLTGKNSSNMKTYADIYQIPEFEHIFENMFK